MGQVLCCFSSDNKKSKETIDKPQRSCLSRFIFCCSENYFLSRLTGKDYHHEHIEDQIARKFRSRQLSFYDYNEEKTNLLEITPSGLTTESLKSMSFAEDDEWRGKRDCDTDNSDMDSISSFQSLDEGAISILSMDQIRNMK